MQIELTFISGTTLLHPTHTLADHDVDRATKLQALLKVFASATCPDVAAQAMEQCLRLVHPLVQRTARIVAASLPAATVEVEDLIQEGMMALAAALSDAPMTSGSALLAFVSSTIFATLHPIWKAAKAEAAQHRGLRRHLARVADAASVRPTLRLVGDATDTRMDRVLDALSPDDTRLLRLRRAGHSWESVARLIGTSRRTAQRRYDAAVVAARGVEITLRDAA